MHDAPLPFGPGQLAEDRRLYALVIVTYDLPNPFGFRSREAYAALFFPPATSTANTSW